ncbi:group 1 truncated hemoglobin [uncultured Maricaulis sp.]|uniref:group I truncated hemoglobin n=1 Tax=uncultured Maricaulis sp. TaxID=174710 RepID=UPI00261EA0B8|nr:group 1 truncated hemoglobin [uncultured Maricaulis sp.]
MLKTLTTGLALTFLASSAMPALAAQDSAPVTPVITDGQDLFERFGGRPGLERIMDDFLVNLNADERTAPFFRGIDETRVKRMLVEQFCVILNGPCTYTGRSMSEAHRGMGVTEADFYALVENLQVAMSDNGVPFRAQNRLLAALAPQHRDIIAE